MNKKNKKRPVSHIALDFIFQALCNANENNDLEMLNKLKTLIDKQYKRRADKVFKKIIP